MAEIVTTMRDDMDTLDNILVRQKDLIFQRINDGAYNEAIAMLHVVRELWTSVNPPYVCKYYELQNIINSRKNEKNS